VSKIRIQFDVPIGRPCSGGGDGSSGETNPFGDRHIRKTVIPLRFVRKPEKGEENDRTDDEEPAAQLNADDTNGIRLPHSSRDLSDDIKLGMGKVPAHVRLHRARRQVEIDGITRKRNCAEDFDPSKTHEAKIPTGTQVPVGCKEFLELGSSNGEFTDGPDCKMELGQHHHTSWAHALQ